MAAHRGHGPITTKDCLVGKKSLDFYEELCLFLNVTKGIDSKKKHAMRIAGCKPEFKEEVHYKDNKIIIN